ncbi:MAG: site-2 protease family protein [Candidatus Kerfeldbacteria bacterium]
MLLFKLFDNPAAFLIWVLAIVVALTIHEFSHGLSAKLQGDPTAEGEGRLTLNPLAHIDWIGFALLVLIGFGWAKPTPFNPYNLKYKRFGPALVALAGPISNIIVAAVISVVLVVINSFMPLEPTNFMVLFFTLLIYINILLAVFNLIPIPPLDGSKILYTFLAPKRPDIVMVLERYGIWILMLLIFFGGSAIGFLIQLAFGLFMAGVSFISADTADAVIGALLGFFNT